MSEEELIEILKAFEKNRVEQLPESARNLFYAIMKIADERDRLNNIINELEKWLIIQHDIYKNIDKEKNTRLSCQYLKVKDKLQELKGSDK